MRTYRELFRAPEFTPLFLTSAVQVGAQTVSGLALGTLIYIATGSPLLSALAMFGPSLAQVIGATTLLSAADRLPPRAAMTGTCLAFGLGTATLAIPGLPLWATFAIILTLGLIASLAGGARYGLLNEILPRESYLLGRSVLDMSVGTMQICGFAVGGVLVTTLSPHGTLLAGASLYLAAAAAGWFGLSPRPPRGRRSAVDQQHLAVQRVAVVVAPAPLHLSRPVGAQRADRRLRIPLRGLCAPARGAPLRLRRTRDAGRRHPGRPVRAASVAGTARSPAAPASRRSVPDLHSAPGTAPRSGSHRARLDRLLSHSPAPARSDGPDTGRTERTRPWAAFLRNARHAGSRCRPCGCCRPASLTCDCDGRDGSGLRHGHPDPGASAAARPQSAAAR